MNIYEWGLECFLLVLLGATLFHARRLERALGVISADRLALQEIIARVAGFMEEADAGIAALRQTAEEIGRELAAECARAQIAKDDVLLLLRRVDAAAERLGPIIRQARFGQDGPAHPDPPPRRQSKAEQDLLKALKLSR
ncbi:MAG: hypothetical protein B7Z78_09755 [Rhodospirillales bacterium 20-60-12]|nr:MAG: hypothetical protein B7Z78_09755 [Rhodospirillales bacterium 20-60-12]HQT67260.1 DUF6468 domain-containing protein [Acetobacteraceae bacterium]